MTNVFRALAVCLLALGASPVVAEPTLELTVYESEHYRLSTNVDPARSKTYARMLEAMWPLLRDFFGSEPKLERGERLDVFFLADAQDWRDKLRADGIHIPRGAGGYYWPGNKSVYLYTQPTIYNTRQLLLHEAMHQFHFLARCNNKAPKDAWYVEGLVEYLSRHYWDGETLTLGVVPTCSLANYAERALACYEQDDYDLTALVESERAGERYEQWALVRFLLEADEGKYRRRWRTLAAKLDRGQTARSVFAKVVGEPKALQPKIRAWLATQQEPYAPVWNEWIGTAPDAVWGTARVTSACRARDDVESMAATLHVPAGRWKGGLLIGFESPKAYTVVLLNDRGGYAVNRRVDGRWRVLKRGKAPAAVEGRYRLRATCGEAGVTVRANDVVLGTFALPGRGMGVCLDSCSLQFSELVAR
ncbi:MAG: hypothetical protein QNJ98_17040 [Planctomycetota bacterium]|nr:hypothetical protein [Planctomycetota bacterium]